MQVHNTPQRAAGEPSAYNSALFAATRFGVNYLLKPVEELSDDDLIIEETPEPDVVEIATMAREARTINDIWSDEAREEFRRQSAGTFDEAEPLADPDDRNADFRSERQAAIGEVKAPLAASPVSESMPVLPVASSSFASVGYGNGHTFSDKLPLALPARPTFKRALKAARRHDRRRSMGRHLIRLVGVALIAAAMLLIAGGCVSPGQDERIYVEGFESAPERPATRYPGSGRDRGNVLDEPFGEVDAPADRPVRVPVQPADGINARRSDGSEDRASQSNVRVHVVRKGETLYAIARTHYGTDSAWRRIARANHIEPPSTIFVGQQLVLPGLSPDGATRASSSEEDVAAYTPTDSEPASATEVTAAEPAGPLARARSLMQANRLAEARRLLSNALYSLNAADEQEALDVLASLNRQLLSSTDGEGDCELYTVAKGDSLYSIARTHNVTWQSLQKLNQLPDSKTIMPGQRLRVLRGQPRLIVVRSRGQLDLWLGDHFLKRYAIGVGLEMPSGTFTIRRKVAEPTGDGLAWGDKRNPYGARMLDVGNPTANIHGSPESVGSPTIPGVMMRNPDIQELFDIVRHGSPLEIR